MTGTVVAVEGGVYTLALADGRRVAASLRGKLKQASRGGDKIVIGDRVEAVEADGAATVEAVLPRRTTMIRRGPGGRGAKVFAANLDRVFIVVAAEPVPNPQLIDRLLAVAEANAIGPVVLVNKVDLPGGADVAAALSERYRTAGYAVLAVSAKSGTGIEALRRLLSEGISAFIGPSGAGKSTLLNRVQPGLGLRTGELSRKTGRGRHTTVSSRLLALSGGGAVADTPGFSDVGLWEMDPAELDRCFPEMRELRDACRFRGCAHVKEPDCAVLEAVAEGRVARDRYESYVALRAEAVDARER
jgi:ribosome biogenesis GTPase